MTWTCEFEDRPSFAGFRAMATNGIDKPVLNVYRMLSKMSGRLLRATSDHATSLDQMLRGGVRGEPDVAAFASLDVRKLCVMVWHYHDDDVVGPDADVTLDLAGLPADLAQARLRHYRIDEEHANACTAWLAMGSPQKPTPEQFAAMKQVLRLTELQPVSDLNVAGGGARVRFALPHKAVSLLAVECD